MAIRNKLVELHEKLLGVTVAVDSPEVDAAFQLFVEVWNRERRDYEPECEDDGCWLSCEIDDKLYFEGIADDAVFVNHHGDYQYDWDRVDEIFNEFDFRRHSPVVQTWGVVLAYLLMDYRYLFL
jgi:hypothetical protein